MLDRSFGLIAIVLTAVACGASPGPGPNGKSSAASSSEAPSTLTTARDPEKVEAFQATTGSGDAPVAYVRDERSSRLDVALPRGRAREAWTVPLGGARREPCNGVCPPLQASFVLAAGNRVAVAGADAWVLFDTKGHRADGGKMESAAVRLDPLKGTIVPDDTRAADMPPDAKVASRNGLAVMVKNGAVFIGERGLEGRFDALEVAIDDIGNACVVVRQANELVLWTMPITASGGIGRQHLPRDARRVLGPPVLGKSLRVLVFDTGIVALGLDGKRAWERRGVPTGGVSITADDHVLVADNGKIVSIDPRGAVSVVWESPNVVFVTPPILNIAGLLLVASGASLHALSFS